MPIIIIYLIAAYFFSWWPLDETNKASASVKPHDFKTTKGAALYLVRFGYETHRAEFTTAHDCEHIAKIMSKAEPLAQWYCSTSTLPFKYNCNLSNIYVTNTETNETWTVNNKFSMLLNRNQAVTSLTPAVQFFNYKETKEYFELTNDYMYADGNFLSRAVYKIKLNRQTGGFIVLDINLKKNGSGVCKKAP